jgi:hypothetical protein
MKEENDEHLVEDVFVVAELGLVAIAQLVLHKVLHHLTQRNDGERERRKEEGRGGKREKKRGGKREKKRGGD